MIFSSEKLRRIDIIAVKFMPTTNPKAWKTRDIRENGGTEREKTAIGKTLTQSHKS
jgi:hypothetical protein